MELVTQPNAGDKELGLLGIALELLAQPTDVDVDGACGDAGAVSPDLALELIAANQLSGALGKVAKELKLAGRERNVLAVAQELSGAQIEA